MQSGSKILWRFRNSGTLPPAGLADKLEISSALLGIVWRRGYTSFQDIQNYLSPRLKNLTAPLNWPHIHQAAEILVKDLVAGKKFAVWGDYDVDGITATTLVLDVLEAHGFTPLYHLPDRRSEGYGVNVAGIEALARHGCQTLLTVDCGISNIDPLAKATALGMNVVISDHHLPPPVLPDVCEIVDPRMKTVQRWPCEHIAGVGVAFYLMSEVNRLLSSHTGKRYKMDDALDLVTLGTLADICTLQGENRILTKAGLNKLSNPVRPGLVALKKISGFNPADTLTSEKVLFSLAPRINAAGRMGHPDTALKLLRCKDPEEASLLAESLNDFNKSRREAEDNILEIAVAQAEELLEKKNYNALVLYGEGWHPGVVGIVASRIVEKYNMPAIILSQEDSLLKGSGRAIPGFDLYDALKESSPLLKTFGGHKMAAGLSLLLENLDSFREFFSDIAKRELGEEGTEKELILDGELTFSSAVDFDFLKELELLQPYGEGNEEPVFSSPLLEVKRINTFGRMGEHVKLALYDEKSGLTLNAKAWRMAEEFGPHLLSKNIRIAYTPKLDSYQGVDVIDLELKDWREEKRPTGA